MRFNKRTQDGDTEGSASPSCSGTLPRGVGPRSRKQAAAAKGIRPGSVADGRIQASGVSTLSPDAAAPHSAATSAITPNQHGGSKMNST
jgi:hypothetical protein